MKNLKGKTKLTAAVACLAMITSLSLLLSDSIASPKAWHFKKERVNGKCVRGIGFCVPEFEGPPAP